MRPDENDEWFEVAEVAAILKASLRTVRGMCASGDLPAIKVGGEWRVSREALESLKHRAFVRAHAPAAAEDVQMPTVMHRKGRT